MFGKVIQRHRDFNSGFFLSLAVQGCCDSNLSILFVTLDDDIQILIVIVTMNRPVSRARSMVGGPLTFRCYGAAAFDAQTVDEWGAL